MKKILSLGVAAAVVSMTAVAASAAIEPVILDEEVVVGSTITVEIQANEVATSDIQFTVVASDNLELVEAEADAAGIFNEETGKFAWASAKDCEDGFVFLTLTYNVLDTEAEDISVAIESGDEAYDDMIAEDAVEAVIVDDVSDEPIPDEPIPDEPIEPDEPIDPIIPDEPVDPIEPEEPDAGNTDTDNVPTGIALAVAPAVIAGAAIVVSKKRK